MPKFFFTTDDGERVAFDDTGTDLVDERSAIDAAQIGLVDIAKSKLPDGVFARFTVDVTDESGSHVYGASLTFEGRTAEQHLETQAERSRQAGQVAEQEE